MMQKQISKFSCPAQFCKISWHRWWWYAGGCLQHHTMKQRLTIWGCHFSKLGMKKERGSYQFPVFCLFYVFDLIWSENQSQRSILSQRESTQLCLGCFDLQPRHKIVYNWEPGGPLFPFSTLIWKNNSLILSTSARWCGIRGSPPAYHHPIVYDMYFK